MTLEIDDTKTVADLQDRFSLCYPDLRLQFCRRKHHWEQICSEHDIINENSSLAVIRTNHAPGIIEIKSWQKVGEVEKEFSKMFGLNVQICYRSGGHWIQTGKSDDVTIGSL